jgi:hypothetical protein
MPDLIYNVKFEIDQASAEKVGQIVDSSNSQDIKVLQREVERLNEILKESSVENSKVKKSVKEKILAYKEEVASLKLLDSKINKSIQVYGEFSDETMALVTDLRMQSEVVDNAGQGLLEYANTTDRTTAEVVYLTNAVSTGNRAMVAGEKRAREMTRAQQIMGGQLGTTNKTFAAGNQAVFSFSDLIQDSTQFSYGFAQGMRAIGNNIGFTAELLAVMSAQAKQAGVSLTSSLMASLKGVNGIVLAINVAVTVATVLLQKFGKQARESAEDLDALSSRADLIISSFQDFSSILGQDVDRLLPLYSDRIKDNVDNLSILNTLLKSQIQSRLELIEVVGREERISDPEEYNRLTTNINSLKKSIDEATESSAVLNSVDEKTLEQIQKKIEAIEEERKVREAIRDLIAESITQSQTEAMVAAARASVPIQIPVDIVLADDIDSSLLETDFDFGAPAGSLAFDLSVLRDLQTSYQNAVTDEERKAIAERIKLKQAEVNEKQELIKLSNQSEEKLAEDSNAITKSQLKAVAQTAATILPSLFEDQKASAIASALVNAGSAIVRQYSDLPLAAAIPASIATAVATQKQIQQIQNTKFGDKGGSVSGGGGGGISPISSSASGVAQPTQSITFLPNAASSGQAPPTVDVKIDRAGLAVAVNKGNRELANKQVRV